MKAERPIPENESVYMDIVLLYLKLCDNTEPQKLNMKKPDKSHYDGSGMLCKKTILEAI